MKEIGVIKGTDNHLKVNTKKIFAICSKEKDKKKTTKNINTEENI